MLKDRQHQLAITIIGTTKMNGKLIEIGSLRNRFNINKCYIVSSYDNPCECFLNYKMAIDRYCQLIKEA